MLNRTLTTAMLAALAGLPMAVQADAYPGSLKGDWIVRAGMHVVNPKAENLQPLTLPNGSRHTLVVDQAASFTFDVTYMFTEHFGLELLAAYPFTHGVDAKPYAGGKIRAADVEHLPPTLSLVWYPWANLSSWRPYIGVGMNYTTFLDSDFRNSFLTAAGLPAGTKLDLEDSFGPAAVAGIDLHATEHWFLNANIRWMDIDTDAEVKLPITNSKPVEIGTIEIDPIVYGLMVGYRFGAPAPAPEPAPVVAPPPPPPPPAKCGDADADGVCDADDKCPATPAGTAVDSVGCPMIQTLKVLFDFDSAELRPESITELERVVKFMGEVPFATALVEGHTDSVGSDAYNLALSDRRAKAVFDYLSSRGVDPARLKSVGKGEAEPIADNATAEGRQQNRRVMLIRTDSR